MLNIPAPSLAASAPLTKPLVIALSGFKYADGSAVGATEASKVGVFVFRGSPGSAELWDEAQKQWRGAPAEEELKQLAPLAATAKAGTATWEATLVAVGQKDGAGTDVYAAAANSSPSYFVRAFAKATHAGAEEVGLSAPSGSFTFVDASANNRFTTQFDTPTTQPDAAHKVRMQLKGDGMQAVGYLEIRAQPNFEVEIANCDASGNVLAQVLLQASGEIRLRPASGTKVIIEGDAETNKLFYAPFDGSAKRWLA